MDIYTIFKEGRRLKNKELLRLQGKDFQNTKAQLTLVAYSVSHRNNVCGYYVYTDELKDENIKTHCHFYHWMNDDEKEQFFNDDMHDQILKVNDIKDVRFPRKF